MRWIVRDLDKVHPVTRRCLTNTTPNDNADYMRKGAVECVKHPGKFVAIALYSGRNLLGWGMLDLYLSHNSPLIRTYLYVKKQHRRHGYGTMILKRCREAARRRGRGIRVCPHTKSNRKFFHAAKVAQAEVAPGFETFYRKGRWW